MTFTPRVLFTALFLAATLLPAKRLPAQIEVTRPPTATPASSVTLRGDRVLDGRGADLGPVLLAVEGGKIRAVGAELSSVHYDLTGLTLLPGLVDTHVHLAWSFDRNGRTQNEESTETPAQQTLLAAENAALTLYGGVTTVQSLGSEIDLDLRDWIERGVLAGPRVLTSIEPLSERTGDPAAQRAKVQELAQRGADVIKIFGSASIRVGGTPTMTQAQLNAACGEAKAQGLRAVVHAHGPESARRAALAGCTTIEHGALLDRDTLEFLAERGVYYDPNIDLVLRNYFENRERFLGVGNYTEEGFEQMRAAVPKALATFQEALKVEGLKIVFGTDALAGSHGRNVEELIYRIRKGGQSAAQAVVSATSLAAESLGLGEELGTIAPGFAADIIGVEGDPLEDPSAFSRVRFVMKKGVVVRFEPTNGAGQ